MRSIILMDKIVEEVLTSLIKRIEALEEKIINLVPTKKESIGTKGHRGDITPGQIDFIIGLGGNIWEGMTSREASDYIDELKTNKSHLRKKMEASKTLNVKDPSAVGNDVKNGVLDNPGETGTKLTQKEIEELGEDAFL